MIGLDTSVIVRSLVQDDPAQAALASSLTTLLTAELLTAEEPGYVSSVVLVEAFWALRRGYTLPTADVAAALLALVSADEILIE